MKRTTVGFLREVKMFFKLNGRYFNHFFKYDPDSLDILEQIIANESKLTQELYSLPTELLYNRNNEYIAYLTKLLKGYHTIYDYIKLQKSYDKDMVARNVATVVSEFENIGLNYYDIHDENFMIDEKGNFKVVDVDGADTLLTPQAKIDRINNFWDFIFEIYLFEFYPEHPVRLNYVYMFEDSDIYFSKEFLEYIDGVIRDDSCILTVEPEIYLPEFSDKEKVNELSKRLELDSKYYGK